MNSKPSGRAILNIAGAAALAMPATYGASALSLPATSAATAPGRPRFEGKDPPKICLEAALGGSPGNAAGSNDEAAAAARRIRHLGVDHSILSTPAHSTTTANGQISVRSTLEAELYPAFAFNVGYTRVMIQAALEGAR